MEQLEKLNMHRMELLAKLIKMNAVAELHLLLYYLSRNHFHFTEVFNEFRELYDVSDKQIYATLFKWNYKFHILEYGTSINCCWLNNYDKDKFKSELLKVFNSISQRIQIKDVEL